MSPLIAGVIVMGILFTLIAIAGITVLVVKKKRVKEEKHSLPQGQDISEGSRALYRMYESESDDERHHR